MSDTTLRLAEACDRAADDMESSLCGCKVCNTVTGLDAASLRALAAALRGAEQEDPGNDPDVWTITLGDA